MEMLREHFKRVTEPFPFVDLYTRSGWRRFDALLQQIGAVLEADPTLGGLFFGLTYGRPEPAIEAIAGAPAIKSATLTVTVDYEAGAPLA